ncbi:Ni/Fe hydrogenase subunit alpha [Candidatus Peregrinibacteria bacterium]|nr:Ni/Fe hydrogenase subunit alpha [Candidatus Peregrinibacteria bacterium]
MHQVNLSIKNLSKIEGHLDMDVIIEDNKVKDVQFKIMENKRFFEKAILGKPFAVVPQLLSRICGTCSVAHEMAAIEAVEDALGYKPSDQTITLRKLMMYGMMIRDHALHLYIFSLPDILNKDSILDFDENNELEHQLLHDMFEVKKAGNYLSTIFGGRAVHAPFVSIGGFLKYPAPEEIQKSRDELLKIRKKIFLLMKVFDECEFSLERETKFVAMKTKDYSFLEGEVLCSEGGFCVQEKYFRQQLKEVVIPYSTAKAYQILGQEYMVGSLARMNINHEALHENTKKDAAKYIAKFPSHDIYKNNLAQAIEILHSIDHAVEILKNLKIQNNPVNKLTPKEGEGVGVIEAPRGTLYHYVALDKEGLVTDAEVVVPTAQNQNNIENDIRHLVQDRLDRDKDKMDKEKVKFEIEKLIRAYDPCMSCATHFLEINWK